MDVRRSNRALESFHRQEQRLLAHIDERRSDMKATQKGTCFRCEYPIKQGDEIVHRAYGDYHARCYRELCHPGPRIPGIMLMLLLLALPLASCASAAKGSKYLQGCTAAISQMTGSVFYERVTVVGVTPQGTDYWVYYPDRRQNPKEGKVYADSLPVERFIERGKLGNVRGRPCKCPGELWGQQSFDVSR